MLRHLKHFLILIRWFHNLLALFPFVTLYLIIYYRLQAIGFEDLLPLGGFLFLCIGVQLLLMAGCVLNDLADREIDRVNKPSTRIIGRVISVKNGFLIFWGITFVLLLVSIYIVLYVFFEWLYIAPTIYFLSIAYDLYLKRSPLYGNITMAFLAALVPIVILFYAHTPLAILNQEPIYVLIWFYALLSFFIIIPRELSLDISDMEGDREDGCRTFPIVAGVKASKIVVNTFLISIILGSLLVMFYYVYLIPVLIPINVMLLFYIWLFIPDQDRLSYIRIGRFLWGIMLFGLVGATVACLLQI